MSKLAMLFVFSFFFLVSACNHTTQHSKNTPKTVFTTVPNKWHIKAKVGIKKADDYYNITIDWQQNNNDFVLALSAPFAWGSTYIRQQNGKLSIDDVVIKQPLEQWMNNHYGWSVPVQKIAKWLFSGYQLDNDWQLEYLAYNSFGNWTLPSKIRLINDDDNIIMTLVIKEVTL